MRVTFVFSGAVRDTNSDDAHLPAPDLLDGWQATDGLMENYLDQDLADLGVSGGRIGVIVRNGTAWLNVVYWLPGNATEELVEQLRRDTIGQLDDGIGEGGFEFNADGRNLIVTALTGIPATVEIVDDGLVVPLPSRIAIGARDGNLASLAMALEDDKEGIDRLHQGFSGLHLAILYGHAEAVRMLLAAGADPNRLDPQGLTPLELCALSNSLDDEQSRELAQILLALGSRPGHVTAVGESARSYAELRGKRRMAEVL